MERYKLIKNGHIKRLSDNAVIPPVDGNKDYQAYLRWVAEGNTPDPIDPPDTTPSFPSYQEQLNAIFTGGQAMVEMKNRVLNAQTATPVTDISVNP